MVLRGENTVFAERLNESLESLAQYASHLDSKGIKETLNTIVPEYVPDFTV